jgi:hypothetical protein
MAPSIDTQHKISAWVHALQFPLTGAVLAIGLLRMFNKNIPKGASDRIVMSVSAKSLIIMAYMVLTEYVSGMKRWASTKANMILSLMETLLYV